MGNPVQRFHENIKSLHHAQHNRDQARAAEHRDERHVKADVKHLKHDVAEGKRDHKSLDRTRAQLTHLKDAEAAQLTPIDRQIANVQTQLQDPNLTPQQLDALNQTLAQLQQQKAQIQDRFDPGIAAARQKAGELRGEISKDRSAIKHDRTEKKKDQKQLERDKQRLAKAMKQVKRARARAKKHLRAAEEHMNLKQTNAARKALGLKPVHHVIRPAKGPTVMYDSVTVSAIPGNAKAVAGYVNGSYVTYPQLVDKFPHAKKIAITVSGSYRGNANCVDVEPGDATNQTALGWMKWKLSQGAKRPIVYTSASNARALINYFDAHGVPRGKYRLWTAHYGDGKHICSPATCGYPKADATQWTSTAKGRNLDATKLRPNFF